MFGTTFIVTDFKKDKFGYFERDEGLLNSYENERKHLFTDEILKQFLYIAFGLNLFVMWKVVDSNHFKIQFKNGLHIPMM